MEIFVNGTNLEFSLAGENEFGAVYTGLAEWVEQGHKRIWSMQIDGTPYDVANTDSFASLPVANIARVDIRVGESEAAKELANRVIGFKADIKSAIGLIDDIVDDIHQGRDSAALEKWRQVLAAMNGFHQVFHILADINISSDRSAYMRDYAEFKDILMEIQKKQELKDYVAFCDQLQYELKPQFEKWLDFLVLTRSSIKKGK